MWMNWNGSKRNELKTVNKYKNKETLLEGIKFASKKESKRGMELLLLQRAGEISDLEFQKKFELQPKFKHYGQIIRAISYIADAYYREAGQWVIEDTKGDYKGALTPEFKIKWKMLKWHLGSNYVFRIYT